ncbi:HHR250Wp [Eremothecium sinecaudum]|uniref:HHR250Wp n=1 Tax=Eremothecium sinecaudum TaxID=45286 RepID=A0A0X8HX06_9SACH|nr:HHR250Wp [Eremothecium sinecaudum]AMD23019.1 HHR250Wp [Eremothecium sinecaudum]
MNATGSKPVSAESLPGSKKPKPKREQINPLDVTESLGYQTYRRGIRKPWSKQDDEVLRGAVNKCLIELGYPNGINSVTSIHESQIACKKIPWEKVVLNFDTRIRKPKDVRKRWTSSLDPNLKKGRWTPEEDMFLLRSYEKHGPQWLKISNELAGRTEDQCAKRYIEVLDPSTKDRLREWTLEEDLALISKVKVYGTKWRQISSEMESRPSLTCRNRWRKIITMVMRSKAPEAITRAVESGGLSSPGKLQGTLGTSSDEIANPNASGNLVGDKTCSSGSTLLGYSETAQNSASPRNNVANNSPNSVNYEHLSSTRSVTPILAHPQASPITQSLQIDFGDGIDSNKDAVAEGSITAPGPRLSRETQYPGSSPQILLKPSAYSVSAATPTIATTLNSHVPISSTIDKLNPDAGIPIIADVSDVAINNVTPHPQPMSTVREWKYGLENHEGLSVGGGSISTEALVHELVEQSKKYGLSINIYQHVHNHYVIGNQHHNLRKINETSSLGIYNFEENNISPFGLNNGFTQDPKYDRVNLQGNHSMSTASQVYIDGKNTSPAYSQHAGVMTSDSYTSPGHDLPDIGPQRMTHFKSLPSNVKLQLGSSAHARYEPDLSGKDPYNRSNKKKRPRNHTSNELQNISSLLSHGGVNVPPYQKHHVPKNEEECNSVLTSSASEDGTSSIVEEEGPDFWETLRQLGSVPISEDATCSAKYSIQQAAPLPSSAGRSLTNTIDMTVNEDNQLKNNTNDDEFNLVMNECIHRGLPFNPS